MDTDEREAGPPHNILDPVVFGRRLRALRILRGYDRMPDFTARLRSAYGVEISDRSAYAIERGEQVPHLDFTVAAICVLQPEPHYFDAALRPDCAEAAARYRNGAR